MCDTEYQSVNDATCSIEQHLISYEQRGKQTATALGLHGYSPKMESLTAMFVTYSRQSTSTGLFIDCTRLFCVQSLQ